MKYIELTDGETFVIVDDELYDWLYQWYWHNNRFGYAFRNAKPKKIYMHRLIANTPDNLVCDHINRNVLDNRKENLRNIPKRLNHYNLDITSNNNTSGYKGVSWDKINNKWVVRVSVMGKTLNLGRFDDPEIASKVYQNFIREQFENEYFPED